jgi:RNA recognition motif. (a.k.a. RRM, RBD, or RNP domain)
MESPTCTLAISNLPDWADESCLFKLFAPTKAVVSVKVSKLRCAGGGRLAHLELNSHENAEGCLRAYNGTMPPNVDLRLEMSWATDTQPKFEGACQTHDSSRTLRCLGL